MAYLVPCTGSSAHLTYADEPCWWAAVAYVAAAAAAAMQQQQQQQWEMMPSASSYCQVTHDDCMTAGTMLP